MLSIMFLKSSSTMALVSAPAANVLVGAQVFPEIASPSLINGERGEDHVVTNKWGEIVYLFHVDVLSPCLLSEQMSGVGLRLRPTHECGYPPMRGGRYRLLVYEEVAGGREEGGGGGSL